MPNFKSFNSWLPIIILGVMAGLIIYSLSGVLTAFLGAVILYVFTRPLMKFLTQRWKWRKGLAAIVIIFLSFCIILGPLILISNILYAKLIAEMQNLSLHQTLLDLNSRIQDILGVNILNEENIQQFQKEISGFIAQLVTQTFSALGNIAIMYFVLYFMLFHFGEAEKFLQDHLPFSKENIALLNRELGLQVYSNALGIPLVAILQGIAAGIFYSIFKVNDPLFWGLITGVFAMIPFVGSALIWVPMGVMMIVNGDSYHGIGILLSGALVVSTIDNVLRLILQKKIADVHPLVTALGILGGIKLFGLAGLIFGPLLLSYFFILLKLYRNKLAVQ